MNEVCRISGQCPYEGEVILDILITASIGSGCQVEAEETPVACSKKGTCSPGPRCLLKYGNPENSI